MLLHAMKLFHNRHFVAFFSILFDYFGYDFAALFIEYLQLVEQIFLFAVYFATVVHC